MQFEKIQEFLLSESDIFRKYLIEVDSIDKNNVKTKYYDIRTKVVKEGKELPTKLGVMLTKEEILTIFWSPNKNSHEIDNGNRQITINRSPNNKHYLLKLLKKFDGKETQIRLYDNEIDKLKNFLAPNLIKAGWNGNIRPFIISDSFSEFRNHTPI